MAAKSGGPPAPPLRPAVGLVNLLFLLAVLGGLLFLGLLVARNSGLVAAAAKASSGWPALSKFQV